MKYKISLIHTQTVAYERIIDAASQEEAEEIADDIQSDELNPQHGSPVSGELEVESVEEIA